MPPEDNANSTPSGSTAKTPDGVLPPEGSGNSSGERNGSSKMVMPPTAPKGKPRAPPLIHGKIKPSEADLEIDFGGSGSKIPLLKSKTEDEANPFGSDNRRKRSSLAASSVGGGSNPKSSRSVKSDSGRSVAASSSASMQHVHRTVEKVKLPKGVEMKRVVQETNGIKTKRFSTTNITSSTAVNSQKVSAATTLTTKESSHQHPSIIPNEVPHRKKMTKTEVTFAGEVKSFLPHHHPPTQQSQPSHPTVAGSSLTNTKSKSNEKNKSPEKPQASQQPSVAKNGVGGFKTVDEFLAMPETSLPDHKPPASPDKKKSSMYKSKFWEYIEPSKNPSTSARSKGPSKGKPYDPDAVKHFMIKQREQRRIQQIRETREKELEASKRKAMLKELENKYQRQRMLQELERKYNQTQRNQQQNTKNKMHARVRSQGLSNFESAVVTQKTLTSAAKVNHAPPPPPPSEYLTANSEASSSKKQKIIDNQSPSMKYLKPLLDRKTSHLLTMRKSSESQSQQSSSSLDVAKQSQYLLSEFENIVKRECISFLQKIPIPAPPCTPASQISVVEPPEKCDKAVATSASLLDLAPVSLESKEWSSKDLKDMEDGTKSPSTPTTTSASSTKAATTKKASKERPPSRRKVRSPSTVENAVTKIQAVYRGYKVRQALKEAKVSFCHHNYQKPTALHKRCTQLQNELGGANAKASENRRWSLPRMPEKPYSSERLMPMSPIPFSSDAQVPCYIPPPSPGAGVGSTGHISDRSPSKPRVLPSFPLTPVRFRYEDPYPKSATKPSKTNELSDFANGNSTSSVAASQDNLHKPSFVTIRPKKESLQVPFEELTPRESGNLEFMVPQSMPSIVDVLREKLRLFQQQELLEAPPPPPPRPPAPQTEKPLIFGAVDPATPKIKKHKRRSRPLKTSPVAESSTTVDTDGDFQGPTTTRSSGSVRLSSKRSHSRHHHRQGSKSEETITSSVTPGGGTEAGSSTAASTTGDGSFGGCLEPALRLRYEAERERLKIIEKALQVRLEGKTEVIPSPPKNKNASSGGGAEVDRVQLAIANCQKESMKAAAEMAKWMSEFQKSTREQEKVIVQQQPPAQVPSHVDLAATVYAAVEHARIMGIEKRRETQKKSSHKISQSQNLIDPTPTDTSCETSWIHAPKPNVADGAENKKELVLEVIREIRDYQQQFPSGSERDSPEISLTKVEGAPPPIPPPPSDYLLENDEDAPSFVNDEPVDYPSIVPSGNSVEFSSLDPKMVSTLDTASKMEKGEEDEELMDEENEEVVEEDDTFVDEEDLTPSVSASKLEDVDDMKESPVFSHKSSIADEASSPQNDKEEPNSQIISVEIPSEEEEEQQSIKMEQVEDEVDDFFDEPSDQGSMTQSKIEEVIASENEKVTEGDDGGAVSAEQSKIEEEIVESVESNVTLTPAFDLEEVKEELANTGSGSFVLSQIEEAAITSLEQSVEVKGEDGGKKLLEEVEELSSVIFQEVVDSEDEWKEESQKSMLEIKTASVAVEEVDEDTDKSQRSILEIKTASVAIEELEEDKENSKATDISEEIEDKAANFKETDISEEIEDKATETELMEILEDEVDIVEEVDKRISSEGFNVEENGVVLVPDVKESDPIKLFSEVDHEDIDEEKQKEESIDSKVEIEEEERISVIEDLVEDDDEEEEEEEENESKESQLPQQALVEVTTAVEGKGEEEEEDFYDDKFEEDVTVTTTEQSKIPVEEKEDFEEKIEEDGKEEDSKSSASAPSSSEPEVPYFKPPPPYSSLFKDKLEDADLPPEDISSAKEVSQQSGESISEEAPSSSQIIDDEASSAAEDEDKLDDKVSADVAVSKPEFEVPLKPPPPYSPTSSLESTSLSSRSLMLSLPGDKLETLIKLQADLICGGREDVPIQANFPGIQQVMSTLTEQNQITSITNSSALGSSPPVAAEQSFDVLLCHLIYETMKEALQLENKYNSFVEKVRPGPLSLQAQKLKIPKSKEALVRIVLRRLLKTIPQQFFSSDVAEDSKQGVGEGVEYKSFGGGGGGGGSRLRKWCSRPRELVDEILLEELIDEDYQWTEWWPEEVIVQHHTTRKIIQNLVRSALHKRKYVYEGTQHHQEQRRQ